MARLGLGRGCALAIAIAAAAGSPAASAAATGGVTLESGFGRMTLDPQTGGLSELRLRDPDGRISKTGLVAPGRPAAYLVDDAGVRYESHLGQDATVDVERSSTGAVSSVDITGIELRSAAVGREIRVGPSPNSVGVAPDGVTGYVSDFGGGTLTPISIPGGTAADPISVPSGPTGVVVADGGKTAYVSSWNTGALAQVDLQSRSVVRTFKVGNNPQWPAMTPDGRTVLVPNQGSASVTPVDVDTGTVGAAASVGSAPISVAITPDGDTAYVTNLGSNSVTQLAIRRSADGGTVLSRVRDIPVGAGPMSVAITPDGQTAVVSLNGAGAVQTIDLATHAVSAPIPVGGQPEDVVLSPDGATAYVANWSLDAVTAVDLAKRQAVQTFGAGPNPNGLGITPDGHYVLSANQGGTTVSRFDVQSPDYRKAPVTEDWHLRPTGAGGRTLSWTITQHWTGDFRVKAEADPSLPMTAGITDTLWYRPDSLWAANPDTKPAGQFFTHDFDQATDESQTWAVYKLWSKYHLASDPRVAVDGGHLVRHVGSMGRDAALGARFDEDGVEQVSAGDTRSLTLQITPEDKHATGRQLAADIPDATTLERLRDVYESILNGGAVSGQSRYLLGNETSGYLTAYQALFDGEAMAAGIPGSAPASAVPYRFEQGFRDYLQAILDDVDDQGATHFGISGGLAWGGSYQDANLHTLLGVHDYVVATGDLGFARRNADVLDRMMRLWLSRVQPNGLVRSNRADGSYYDALFFGGTYYSTYVNALVHGALTGMADLSQALADQATQAGDGSLAARDSARAAAYTQAADELERAMNRELWTPDSPHGPMYADWINGDTGQKVYSFMSSAQYTAIVLGVASREQAREILATADSRYAELAAKNGYEGHGALTALWPLPDEANYLHWPFGVYMNGGILHYETYFEVVARAMAGDGDGAYHRLKRFADGFAATSWWGSNAANIDGSVPQGGEPYLQDMVMVPAALVQGVLGVRPTWRHLTVSPALPAGWDHAAVQIMYKGRPYCVSVAHGQAETLHGPCSARVG